MSTVAVEIVDACKYYPSKNDRVPVLDHLNLTLHEGTIYSLLGSSGCGKTTLLSCLMSIKSLNSGTIRIFGEAVADAPGPSVGYMPQENALHGTLTVRETMKYFGWLAGMSTRQIEKKLDTLVDLLMVPDVDLQVAVLSGGEQRRVSLGIVLLLDPELLILDEPTVGLDSLLRRAVWDHLTELTKHRGKTILLTTHYIEETKQADMVGLMRNGYIIAEAPPKSLLNQFGASTLEEVFLRLSIMQNESKEKFLWKSNDQLKVALCNRSTKRTSTSSRWCRIAALAWKQFVMLFRNIPLLLFTVMSVSFSVTVFFVGIGHAPKDISVGVVDYERDDCGMLLCNSTRLGCHYVDFLREHFRHINEYDDEAEAEDLLLRGLIHGYVVVKNNYTSYFKNQLGLSGPRTVRSSAIDVYRDVSVRDISYYVQDSVAKAHESLIDGYSRACNATSRYAHDPFEWKLPVFGDHNVEMTDNGAPPYTLMVMFCVAAIVSSCSILVERAEGTYDRITAMGVGHAEVLISHIITDLSVILVQIITSLTVVFVVFSVSIRGSALLAFALAFLNSFSGMCCGYAISSVFNSESGALHVISGSMTPSILLSGVFWPREGMHPWLRAAAWFLPITQPADAMKNIIHRGWNLSKAPVYFGFMNAVSWALVFLAISVIILKKKRK